MKILSGIITYNPDLSRLKDNLNALINQVDKILVVDNDSKNILELENFLRDYSGVDLIKNVENSGVARALNQEAEYGIENGFEWLLSLDQDSVVPPRLIKEYKKYTDDKNIGMLTCKIKDRNFGELDYLAKETTGTEYVVGCITSASLLRLEAWEKTGGYYEPYFIDSVDFDLCCSLTEAGYKILKTNNIALLHEVGNSSKVHILGKDRQLVNHSPLRYYYIYRNGLNFGLRHHLLIRNFRHYFFAFILMNLYEKNRLAKDKMVFKGIRHFIIGKYGRYDGK